LYDLVHTTNLVVAHTFAFTKYFFFLKKHALHIENLKIPVRSPQKPKKVKVDGSHKRKTTKPKEIRQTGTVIGHYMSFITKTLNQIGKFPQMKGF
jgi:hypothetical protein